MPSFARVLLLLLGATLATACKGLSDMTAPRPVETPVASVVLSSEQLTLSVGNTIALQVTARDASNRPLTDRNVVWSSSDSTIARVSSAGLVTALRPGTVQIAVSIDGRSAVASVTIIARSVASVQVTPTSPSLLKGGFLQLTARTLDETGALLTDRPVAWGTSDAKVAVVDVGGLVTGISPGVATLTATSEARTAAVGVTVSRVPVSSVQLTPTRDSVVLGQATQLTAVPRDSTGAPLDDLVAFGSSAGSVATVSSSGLVLGIAPGTAIITASSGGRSATANIIVLPRPVGAVIVSPAQTSLTVGQSVRLSVQITDGSGNLLTGRPISFSSGNVNVAQVASDGMVTVNAPGTATITVTSEGKTGTASITGTPSPIATLRVDPPTSALLVGGSARLSATALDAGGNVLAQRTITWTSGAPNIASVNADGVVNALGSGTALIFAAAEGRLAAATIVVAAITPSTIVVAPSSATVIAGQSLDLAATLRDGAGQIITGRAIQWVSNGNAVAIVSSGGRVRGVAPGTAQIDATVDGVTGSSNITVIPVPITTITVNLAAASVIVGQTTQATAVARDSVGGLLTGRAVVWSSSSTSVATVSATGVVTAVALGTANIIATSEGKVGQATLSVVVGSPTTLAANSAIAQSATAGSLVTAPPSVRVTDAGGTPVSGVSVTFALVSGGGSISPTTPAAVVTNASGVASLTSWTLGATAGANSVTATVGGLAGSPVTFSGTGTVGTPTTMVANSVLTQTAVILTAVSAPPSVRITDAGGNPVVGVVVTFTRTVGGGTLVPATPATVSTNALGIATLTSWTLGATIGANAVTAAVTGLTGSPVTFTATGTVGTASSLTATSVLTQSATVSSAVAAPPSARVADAGGNGVSGVTVTFTVASGGGATSPASPASVLTNASGVATLTSWTLGATAGANTVSASAVGLSGSPLAFAATGTAGAPTTLAATSATTQSATAGNVVSAPPSVRVTDAFGNPVSGVVVTFVRTVGAGVIVPTTPAAISTNALGIASLTSWTLGATAGANTVTATAAGLTGSPVTFNATGTVGAASALSANSVVSQSTAAGTAVGAPPSARVTDAGGNGVSGVTVTFAVASGGGATSPASPASVVTNASGVATLTSWTLGATAGANSVSATVSGLSGSPRTFAATGTAGSPTAIAANSVITQSATAGGPVGAPPSVRVTDAFGNAVSGISVTFTRTVGTGTLSPASPAVVSTNALGIATLTSWTLGATAGANTVTASAIGLSGSPVTFTATGTVGSATTLAANSVLSQSTVAGSAVGAPPSARVTDAGGNGVSGVTVIFTVTSGGGATSPASPASVVTNASGVATLTSWTLGATAGANAVSATASGLSGSPLTFTATGTAGSATTIASNSVTTQSAVVLTAVSAPPSVRVTDVGGNPVSGVSVTFTRTVGGGTIVPATPAVVSTNALGIATLTSWTLGATVGANTVTAAASGLSGSPVTFSATGTVGAATTLTANSVTTQSALVSSAVSAPPSARVTDAGGNGVSGVTVTFAVSSGGGSTSPASPASVVTNASGVATLTSWTLGATAGANSVSATASGLSGSPLTFAATGTAGSATNIAANSVLAQSAVVLTAVGAPPSVRVTDVSGNPVSGVSVTFTRTVGGGTIVPATPAVVSTNALGIATLTSWTLGATIGANTVTATAGGLSGSPVTFNATGTVGAASTLSANSVVSQSSAAGTAVSAPPSVRVTDAGGNGVSGVTVTFAVASGGGAISPSSPASVVTNASGVATLTSWTLGATAGANTVSATAAGLSGSPLTFSATGTAGAATTIAANSVTTQSAVVLTAVSAPPSVRVTDVGGNPVSGVSVTFTTTAGAGTLSPVSPAVVSTNALGIATLTSWTLGATIGTNTVTATAAGLTGSPVTFSATGTVGAASTLSANSVVSQSTAAGTAVSAPPSARVTDAGGNGVSGVTVTFTLASGGGAISPASPASVVTNASGVATLTSWTLGATAGANTVNATAPGLGGSPLLFSATGTVGAATTIAANSVLSQSAVVLTAVSAPPSVRVTDVGGNPVSGVSVTFTTTAGAGTLSPVSPAVVSTNALGIATLTSWTLGATIGTNTVTATAAGLTGSPVTFSATGTVGAASTLSANSVVSQSTAAGTAVTAPPSARVTDAGGNGVSGVTVTFAVASGGGAISPASPASVVTNASGLATLTSWTLGATAGANTVSATAAGLSGSPLTFSATGTAGSATTIAANSVTTQSAVVLTAVSAPPSVRVTDVGGNPVSGVSVTFTMTAGVGTLSPVSPAVVSTNALGIATLTSWTLGATVGTNTVTAAASGLAGSPVAFNATGTVGAASTLSANSVVSQSTASGTAVSAPPSARVTDAGGNGVSGVTVTFTVASGGGATSPASPASVVTNASGVATLTSWTLGATAGANSVSATAAGLSGSPLTFSATGTAGAATTIAANSVTTQSATAGTAVSAPPSARVTDVGGNPVSGVSVTFTMTAGAGTLSPASPAVVSTNALGIATLTSWTLGATVGANTVTAAASGLSGSPVTFNATGTVGAASTLSANSVATQSTAAGTAVSAPPSARVTDAGGNGVSGVTVTFTVTSGGGATSPASPASVVTNASGVATLTSWTLGATAGANAVSATASGLSGSPLTFSATGTAGSATTIAANSVTTQSAVVLTAVSAPPSVRVTDVGGNPVSGVSVTFTMTAGAGTLSPVSPAVVSTNALGIATLTSWTLGATVGTNTVTAAASGLSGSPVTFNATGTVGAAATLAANSVTAQSAAVSSAVAAPPSARATDAGGNPVSGVSVTFTITAGAGTLSPVSPAVVTTNALGIATLTSWTLGAAVGTNTVSATAAGLSGSPLTFSATGTAGAATTIAANSVTTQSAVILTAVSAPPSVTVTDIGGNPVSGVSVTFTRTVGGGTIVPATPAVVSTNALGIATLTSWTLGATIGANTVTAAAAGLTGSPVTFNATGTVGAASTLSANSVVSQSTAAGTAVSAPPSARVTDAGGNGVSGVTVTFAVASGGGATSPASPASVVTNASGVATLTSWTLGATVGANTVSATAAGLSGSPLTFSATGSAGAATTIAANSVTTQSTTAGTAVTAPPSVTVTDVGGNGVSGVTVTFTVTSGAGVTSPASPASVVTNASGVATLTSWTLGATAGANTVTAAASGLSGSPVTFTATGTVGAASILTAISVTTQSASVSSAVSASPSARVTDAGGNGVSGVTVTFTVTSGGGTTSPASPASVVTNASGVATLTSWTLGAAAGTNTVSATAAGLTGSPLTFSATGTAGAATTIAANSVTTQSATAGSAVSAPPSAKVTDVGGNPVSGVNVTFTMTAGAGTLSPASPAVVSTNALGIATLTSWTLGSTVGANTVTATASGLSGSPVTFNATGTVGAATTLTANSVTTQSATVSSAVSAPPSARVTDAGGNGVSGVTVTFTVTSGAGATSPASPASVVTNASGVATLTSWTLGAAAGANTVSATAAGLTGSPLTFTATGTAGSPTQLGISTQPAGAVSGVVLTTQPVIEIRDAGGTLTTSTASVTAAIASGTGALSGTTIVAAVNGVATFTNLQIAGDGAHTLTFTSGALTLATSGSFTVTQVAASLQVQTQPAGAINGVAFTTQPVVHVLDNAGLVVTTGSNANEVVTAALATGTGTLGGTLTAMAANGVATFANLQVTGTGAHTIQFTTTTPSLSVTSATVTVGPGTPTQLAMATQPSGAVSGVVFTTQPVIEIRDAGGALTTSGASVTVAIASGNGTLTGTTTVTAVNGVATFTDLQIAGTGAHTLTFTSGVLTATTSTTFTVTQVAASLVVQTQPVGAASGSPFATQPVIHILDNAGLLVTTGSHATLSVTVTILSGPGALGITTTVGASNGVATFGDLVITGAGDHVLRFATTVPALSVSSVIVVIL